MASDGITFEYLIKHKSITKNQVSGWLSQIGLSHLLPNWSNFSNDLTYGAMEKMDIAKPWQIYRTLALGAGNPAIDRVRARIRRELKVLQTSSLTLTPLTEGVFNKIWSFAKTTISDLTSSRAKAMIIYEVVTYDAAGNVQKAPKKPADQKL